MENGTHDGVLPSWDPEALFSPPLKTLHNQRHSECFPRCRLRSALYCQVGRRISLLSLFLPFFSATSQLAQLGKRARGFMPVLKGKVTHLSVWAQVTGSAPIADPAKGSRENRPQGTCPSHISSSCGWPGTHPPTPPTMG